MDLWEALALNEPGILACTGAGGKTSLLLSLTECAYGRFPIILTTTTKMYGHQVEAFRPTIEPSFSAAIHVVNASLEQYGRAAWFSRREGDKVIGLMPDDIDKLAVISPDVYILVEADGAKEKLLKAPNFHEPLIPSSTAITVGVLNLQALGQPLEESRVHRLEQVSLLLGKGNGETITPKDLALLACHSNGIFQYSKGKRVLVLTGAGAEKAAFYGREVVDSLRSIGAPIERCVLTAGYGATMEPIEVYDL